MMHKRTLHSLLIVSFIVVFAASMPYAADEVIVGNAPGLQRCQDWAVDVTANLDADVSAIEIILDVSTLSDCGDLTVTDVVPLLGEGILTDQVIDFTTMAPLIRFAAMSTGPDPELLAGGTGIPIFTIEFTTTDCCLGEAEIVGGTWPADPPFGVIETQFVDAGTSALRPAAVTAGVVGMENDAPTISDIVGGPFTILHGDLFEYELEATDPDLANICENLTFSVENGPDGMSVLMGNMLTWQTDGDDVCEFVGDIVIRVSDDCGATDDAEPFQICVTNNPPDITVYPTELQQIAWGMTYNTTIEAVDPDPGPYGPFFNVINWGYVAPPPVIDINTGELTWVTDYEPEYTGLFTVEVEVDDGANECDPCALSNSNTITFDIEVVPFQLTIAKIEDVILGQEWVVPITMLDDTYVNKAIGGFDFLIQYDQSAMMFMYAEEGQFLVDCEWEYFTYRYGPYGNCGPGACPSGVLRVVAMGETTGGNLAHHPVCWTNGPGISNELVRLHFLVSNDFTLECNFAPIRWVWYDCADNAVSDTTGEWLFISNKVFDFAGFDEFDDPIFNEVTGLDPTMPTLTGAPSPECDVETDKGHPWRLVHFYNGGLDLICSDSIDAVGDINLNSIAYEIADAVMFTNYFIDGLAAFGTHVDGSIAASDTNKDGITLSVADLVYLIRVIIGDALPYAKEINVTTVPGSYTHDAGVVAIPDLQVGGVALVVNGEITPTLTADGATMTYGHVDGNTRIVVTTDPNASSMNGFSGNFVGGINSEIVTIEAADVAGNPIALKNIPANYELSQNYPNPFNPTTTIGIAMSKAGKYELAIYNIQGQVVDVISGSTAGAERVTIDWDASNLASGVYLYRLTAGDYTAVKKAILLK